MLQQLMRWTRSKLNVTVNLVIQFKNDSKGCRSVKHYLNIFNQF